MGIPATDGIFLIIFSINATNKIQEPIQVKTPNTTLFCGIAISVTKVTKAPPPNTISPLFKWCFPREKQKPDNKMKVQQILCCHT